MMEPQNNLERALWAVGRGPEAYPEFYECLREAELAYLMPYHPELEGEREIRHGSVITFSFLVTAEDGQHIPIFTSRERAQSALDSCRNERPPFCIAVAPAKVVLQMLAGQKDRAILNPYCGTPTFEIDPETARQIGDGSILKPDGERVKGKLQLMHADEYPTELLTVVHRYLRTQARVRAAWLFHRYPEETPDDRYYIFGLYLTGDEDFQRIRGELSLVVSQAINDDLNFGISEMDPDTNPGMAGIIREFPPFYAAPDSPAPQPATG